MDSSPSIKTKSGSPIDMSNDFDFRLEFDIEEDIEGELEDFVRLARLGLADEARKYFQETLQSHLSLFPVLAEYAEFLVSEGDYDELSNVLHQAQTDAFSADESWLVTLLKTLTYVYMDANTTEALETARAWHRMQPAAVVQEHDEVKLQCLEIYLRTLVFFESQGVMLEPDLCQPSVAQHQGQKWLGFQELLPPLLRDGRLWEAHNIVTLLFEVSQPDEAEDLYKTFMQGIKQEHSFDESQIAAKLCVTNAYLNFRLIRNDIASIESSLEEFRGLEQAAKNDLLKLFPDFPNDGSRHTAAYMENVDTLSRRVDSTRQTQPELQKGSVSPKREIIWRRSPRGSPKRRSAASTGDTSRPLEPIVVVNVRSRSRSLRRNRERQYSRSRSRRRYSLSSDDSDYKYVRSYPNQRPIKSSRRYDRSRSREVIVIRREGELSDEYSPRNVSRVLRSTGPAALWHDTQVPKSRTKMEDRRGMLDDEWAYESRKVREEKIEDATRGFRSHTALLDRRRQSEEAERLGKQIEKEEKEIVGRPSGGSRAEVQESGRTPKAVEETYFASGSPLGLVVEPNMPRTDRDIKEEIRRLEAELRALRHERRYREPTMEIVTDSKKARPEASGNNPEVLSQKDSKSNDRSFDLSRNRLAGLDLGIPTYIRVNKKYMLAEVLERHGLPWEHDERDHDYIIIKQNIDQDLQDELFEESRRLLRRRRDRDISPDRQRRGTVAPLSLRDHLDQVARVGGFGEPANLQKLKSIE